MIKMILCEDCHGHNQTFRRFGENESNELDNYIKTMTAKNYFCHEFDYVTSYRNVVAIEKFTVSLTS